MKYPTLLLSLLTIISCTSRTSESTSEALVSDSTASTAKPNASGFDQNNFATFLDLTNYLTGTEPKPSDLMVIDSTCAIIIDPSQDQISKMEKDMGEDFATIADDNGYYQSEAFHLFDSAKVKTVFAEKPFLLLKGETGSWTLDIRKEGAPEWNVILFNPGKKPLIIPAIDVTYEKVKEYFNN